ncbi:MULTISPECIES: hypothetical protein, partial [Streptomyces]|uniref:hypothetical protein n=1 Tax=Streptomyces TaxID=1883 RepID=UPI0033E338E2
MVLTLDSALEERTRPFQLFRGRDLLDDGQLKELLATMPTADVAKIAVVPDRTAAGAASRHLLDQGIVVRDLSGAPGLP